MDKQMFRFYKAALSGEITTPLCAEYKTAWRKCGDDKGMLIRLAMSQQSIPFVATHAYQDKGITKEYVKEQFKDYINGCVLHNCDGVNGFTYGLFVDWDYENDLLVDTDVASIMWTEDANVVVAKTKCPTIYVSNKSDVHLIGEGFNTIRVYLFDESKVTIDDLDENSSIIVYRYSTDSIVDCGKYCLTDDVKVFDKKLRL